MGDSNPEGGLVLTSFQPPKRICWFGVARPAPIAKFRHIHTTIPGLTIEDPGLGSLEGLSDVSLSQAGFLAKFLQKRRDSGITTGMLGFGEHGMGHYQ